MPPARSTRRETADLIGRLAGLMAGPRADLSAKVEDVVADLRTARPALSCRPSDFFGVFDVVYADSPLMGESACVLESLGAGLYQRAMQPGQLRWSLSEKRAIEWADIKAPIVGLARGGVSSRVSLSGALSFLEPDAFHLLRPCLSLCCTDPCPSAQEAWRATIGHGALAQHLPLASWNRKISVEFFDGTWMVAGETGRKTVLLRSFGA